MLSFSIPITPVAQARPRAVNMVNRRKYYRPGKPKIILHDPTNVKRYKQLLGYYIRQHYEGKPLTGPLRVTLRFYRQVQKSVSKTEHDLRIRDKKRPIVKPDVSNYVKSTEDALNGILWKDDAQIVIEGSEKHYSDNPRIEIEVEQIESEGL